jgi:predicted ATPase
MLSRFEALRSGETPLVGRGDEIELLLRRWEQAKTGEGRAVLISGEPGIGKSRLTAALSEQIGTEPHTRLRYFCSPHHQDSALYPYPTRRSVLRGSLTLATAGSLVRPFIANAAAKTATVWWVQGFAEEEDVAFKKLVGF